MTIKQLMGNAAAAHAALEAGASVVCGYPGTPSSEVLETAAVLVREAVAKGTLAAEAAPHIEWSTNEKAALEVALGASMAGARALVTMKQVGLNVAADPLMTAVYLGVKGGLVLYVADDPGPISSQTEQDTRAFAQFAHVPVLDPSTPEELFAMVGAAFELSERHGTPVIVRPTTRICHGSAPVETALSFAPRAASGFERDARWVIFPPLAHRAHLGLPARLAGLAADEVFSRFNVLLPSATHANASGAHAAGTNTAGNNVASANAEGSNTRAPLGIVASGISWAYLLDALDTLAAPNMPAEPATLATPNMPAGHEPQDSYDILKMGAPYPLDDDLIASFLARHECVIVFEELEATLERELLRIAGAQQLSCKIFGKLTGHTSTAGENSVALITAQLRQLVVSHGAVGAGQTDLNATGAASATGAKASDSKPAPCSVAANSAALDTPAPPPRPPVLCAGCPHRASFYAVKQAMRGTKASYSGDIGCYTLGNALPLDMVDTCVCMGAGFTVPQGMHWAEPGVRHLGFVGDSTFFASGLTGVVNAVYNQAPVTLIVLDNATTAMTGTQPHPGTGLRMSFDASPLDKKNALSIPRVLEALGLDQVHVVDPFNQEQAVSAVRQAIACPGVSAVVFQAPCVAVCGRSKPPAINAQRCTGCRACINRIGCPALSLAPHKGSIIEINHELCWGCTLCTQVCALGALA